MDLCICNLILATIVHSAEEARHKDVKFIDSAKKALDAQQRKSLIEVCQELDTDKSGTLSDHELLGGYEENTKFQSIFQRLGLDSHDVKSVLSLADEDGSGDVDYMEFINTLMQMKSTDPKVMLMLLKHDINDLRAKHNDSLAILESLHPLPSTRTTTIRKTRVSRPSRINMSWAHHPVVQVQAANEEKDTQQISTDAALLPPPLVLLASTESSRKTDTSPTSQQETCNAIVSETIGLRAHVWEAVVPSTQKTPIELGPMLGSGANPSHNEYLLHSSPSPSITPIELGLMLGPEADPNHNEHILSLLPSPSMPKTPIERGPKLGLTASHCMGI